jgi:hypothetical protein
MCTRPQDTKNKVIERPFCSRVTHENNLGINPEKPKPRKERKSKVEINHCRSSSSLGKS